MVRGEARDDSARAERCGGWEGGRLGASGERVSGRRGRAGGDPLDVHVPQPDPPRSALGARRMFRDAAAFNGDLSRWDVSKVTYMGS